jgi:hypothetical protein
LRWLRIYALPLRRGPRGDLVPKPNKINSLSCSFLNRTKTFFFFFVRKHMDGRTAPVLEAKPRLIIEPSGANRRHCLVRKRLATWTPCCVRKWQIGHSCCVCCYLLLFSKYEWSAGRSKLLLIRYTIRLMIATVFVMNPIQMCVE